MDSFATEMAKSPTAIVDTPLIKACFSPCGYQLWSGEQSGRVLVYKSDTGDLTTVYDTENDVSDIGGGLGISGKIVDVAYHPHEHMVAFCAFGDHQPVMIFTWDEDAPQKEILVWIIFALYLDFSRLKFQKIQEIIMSTMAEKSPLDC